MTKSRIALLCMIWLSITAWAAEHEVVQVRVFGLACPFCAYGVEKSIGKLEGVDSVKVDLAESRVDVVMLTEHKANLEEIKQAIVNAGFTPGDASTSMAAE